MTYLCACGFHKTASPFKSTLVKEFKCVRCRTMTNTTIPLATSVSRPVLNKLLDKKAGLRKASTD